MKFDVLLTTQILSLNFISEDRDFRHRLIMKLHEDGFSDKEISNYLNEKGIVSPRGLDYYPKLIWVTRKKLRDREVRKENYEIEIGKMSFYLMKQ
ncbi:MAG: recombinase family protein [Spirochaetia bacterium]|nr:recombinase family protein [Spirochaetia bacterium]